MKKNKREQEKLIDRKTAELLPAFPVDANGKKLSEEKAGALIKLMRKEARKRLREKPEKRPEDKSESLKYHILAWEELEKKRKNIESKQNEEARCIATTLENILRPIIPDIGWQVGRIDECGLEVNLVSLAIETDYDNPNREYNLQALIENYFPPLCFIVETGAMLNLTAEEADKVIEALGKLWEKEGGND